MHSAHTGKEMERLYKVQACYSIPSTHVGQYSLKCFKCDRITFTLLWKWDNALIVEQKFRYVRKEKTELRSWNRADSVWPKHSPWVSSDTFQGKQQFRTVLLLIKRLCGLELFTVSCWERRFTVNRKASTNPREWVPIAKANLNQKLQANSLHTSNSSIDIKPSSTS